MRMVEYLALARRAYDGAEEAKRQKDGMRDQDEDGDDTGED